VLELKRDQRAAFSSKGGKEHSGSHAMENRQGATEDVKIVS
jgi:hypothetical protein